MADRTDPYVIRPGDYTTAIAYTRGVKPEDIWQHPSNAPLREMRKNPELLAPGDVLFVPVVEREWLSAKVGEANRYVADPPRVAIHVLLKNHAGEPFAHATVRLTPRLTDADPSTDGDGLLTLQVPVNLHFVDATLPDAGVTFRIRVGHLDPHDVPSGTLSRLRQLGYIADESLLLDAAPPYLESFDVDGTLLECAIAAYQDDQGEDVTGQLDDKLCSGIRDEYGC